jgi:hypothetical protein
MCAGVRVLRLGTYDTDTHTPVNIPATAQILSAQCEQEHQQAEGEVLDVNGFPMDTTTLEADVEADVETQVETVETVAAEAAAVAAEMETQEARAYFEEWSPMSKEQEAARLKVKEFRLGG